MQQRTSLLAIFIQFFFPLVVGVFFVGLTFVTWQYSRQVTVERSEAFLDEEVNDLVSLLQRRVAIYNNLLHGARALFMASDDVTRDEWMVFVQNLDLANHDPGVTSLVYLPRVTQSQREAFNQAARKEANATGAAYLKDFTIFPIQEKNEYFPIYYTHPISESTPKAIGFDHSSEPIRNQALELSRDTGETQLSGTFKSVTTQRNSFVMYIPIFNGHVLPATLDQRREMLKGYIFAGFSNESIFQNILDEAKLDDSVAISLYDGDDSRQENLLFEKSVQFTEDEALVKSATVEIAGRTWLVKLTAPKDFGIDDRQKRTPRSVIVLGGMMTFLATGFVYALLSSRRRAMDMARSMTRSLQESEEKYRSIFESFQDVYYQTDMEGKILLVSPSIERWTGQKPAEVIGKLATDFYPNPEQRQKMLKALMADHHVNDFEIDLRGKGDQVIKVSVSARLMLDERQNPVGVEGVLRDITNRKKVEDEVAEKNRELERMNKLMTDRELKMIELKKQISEAKTSI